MKMLRAPSVLLGVAASLAACRGTSRSEFAASDRSSITALLEHQQQAWNRGDIAAFMKGYLRGPDLVFTSGGQIRRGWQETFERYRARYGEDPSTMGRLSFKVLDLQALGADGAVVLGRWALSGLESPAGGIFSVVLARGPEGWRIVHDHTSSDPAP